MDAVALPLFIILDHVADICASVVTTLLAMEKGSDTIHIHVESGTAVAILAWKAGIFVGLGFCCMV